MSPKSNKKNLKVQKKEKYSAQVQDKCLTVAIQTSIDVGVPTVRV